MARPPKPSVRTKAGVSNDKVKKEKTRMTKDKGKQPTRNQPMRKAKMTTTEAATHHNGHNVPFLRLPPEVRNTIYEFALTGNEWVLCYNPSTTRRQTHVWEHHTHNASGLLRTCRQVYHEAHLLPYKLSVITTRNNFAWTDWPQHCPYERYPYDRLRFVTCVNLKIDLLPIKTHVQHGCRPDHRTESVQKMAQRVIWGVLNFPYLRSLCLIWKHAGREIEYDAGILQFWKDYFKEMGLDKVKISLDMYE